MLPQAGNPHSMTSSVDVLKDTISSSVNSFETKLVSIQTSIQQLLAKLEQQEHLQWADLLNNYSVISKDINELAKMMRGSGVGETGPTAASIDALLYPTKHSAVFPNFLSLDTDPNLQQVTEGRVSSWNHQVVPDFLQKDKERSLLHDDAEVQNRVKNVPEGTLQKHINALNKHAETLQRFINDEIKPSLERRPETRRTADNAETRKLMAAFFHGEGLRQTKAPVHPTTGPSPLVGGVSSLMSQTTGGPPPQMGAGGPNTPAAVANLSPAGGGGGKMSAGRTPPGPKAPVHPYQR